jgi:drug/metabolite transporter (DMT)-like permease
MPQVTLVIGILLTLLGVISYFASDGSSLTALIPAAFGVVFIALGQIAKKETARKHMMHFAVGLAMIGFLGVALRAFAPFFSMLQGGEVEHPGAVIAQVIMGLLCLILVAFGIRSFANARRAKPE